MRKFYLENRAGFENFRGLTSGRTYEACVAENIANNNRICLNDEDGIFLFGPSGLGIEFSHDYGESGGDGFFYKNKFRTSQLGPEFNLLFDPNKVEPYKKYRALLDWIADAKDLYLIYSPYGEEYYRKVDVQRIEKSEINILSALQVVMSVSPLTPWFLPVPVSKNMNPDSSYAKRYNYTYDSNLKYGRDKYDFEANIVISGHIPAAIQLTYTGAVSNPVIILFGTENGITYGECSISEVFSSTDKLVLSTAEQDSYVKKVSASGDETDLIDKIDITKDAFFRIPLKEPCTIRISGGGMTGTTDLKIYQYYREV